MAFRLPIIVLSLCLFAMPSRADSVQIDALFDASFFDAITSRNLGGNNHISAGVTNSGDIHRAVFWMDIAGLLPSGAIVNSASFEFDVTRQGGPQGSAGNTFSLHRVLTDWDEGTGTGNLGSVTNDGATWDNATAATTWTTPGGDFASTDSGQAFVDYTGPGSQTFSLGNAQLAADVQAMLDGTVSNYGFLLLPIDESAQGSAMRITSREGGNAARLVIDFTVVSGDINADGFVGAADLDLLLANWGTSSAMSDADGDGTVGQGDLDIVISQWGDGTLPDVNIPEPGALALLATGGLLFSRRRRTCRV
ncbi:MAG: DNRLRE domain-containing protein [Planctomycetota bacterium]